MGQESQKDSAESYLGKAVLFRKDNNDRTVFYPLGALSKGYCIPDSSKQEEIKNLLMINTGIWLVVASICIFIGQDKPIVILFLAIFLLLSGLLYRIKLRRLLKGLEVVDIGSESYSPPTIDKRYRGLFIVILFGGLVGGIGDIYNKGFSIADLLLLVGSVVLFILFGYISWVRK